jgi:hypothetical protein
VSEEDKHVLRPSKFDVKAPRNNTVDAFGQQYSADDDESKWSDSSPQDSRKAHARSDVDLSPRSLHHTLGTKHNQASPGDHYHDGTNSKKIGPLQMDPTAGNEGKTRAEWTIPVAPTVNDLVTLLQKFVNFRQV